jgi:hypothetical protein
MQDDLIQQKQEELEILKKYGELVQRKQQEIDELRPDAEAWKAFSGSKKFVDARSAANTLTRRTGYNVKSNVTLYRYLREIGVMPWDGSYVKTDYQGVRFNNCNCVVNGQTVKVVHISGAGIDWLADKIVDDPRFLKKFSKKQLENRGLLE